VIRSAAIAAVLIALAANVRAQDAFPAFPLALHVAEENGAPVVDDAWIATEIAQANAIFAASGVSFEERSRVALDARRAHVETRADRHALGAELTAGRVNVFFVASLRDVDDTTLMRRGVHWRPAGMPGAHFVIVSSVSGPDVLAHELGHFFGNPHSDTPNDVMSYQRDGTVVPFFERAEIAQIRGHARRFRARSEIEE
jgi:hypothetical protein